MNLFTEKPKSREQQKVEAGVTLVIVAAGIVLLLVAAAIAEYV